MKTSHFESGIAQQAAIAALINELDTPTNAEAMPAEFHLALGWVGFPSLPQMVSEVRFTNRGSVCEPSQARKAQSTSN